jgi:DNA polymerase III subunit delta'
MLFKNSIIHNKIKSFFEQVINNERLAHAYLFHGKAGCGKTAFALELAKACNCQNTDKPCGQCPSCIKIEKSAHPDVKLLFPVSKAAREDKYQDLLKEKMLHPFKKLPLSGHLNIPIESIRELKKEAMYAPYEARRRFFIISGIEFFSREAANSFLKLLEEPPDRLQIILISNDYNSVIDTIRSRCQPILFPQLDDDQIKQIVSKYKDEPENLTTLIRINEGNIEEIIEQLGQKDEDMRPLVLDFMRASVKGDAVEINTVTEQIVQTRDKNKALEFINLMIIWLGDAFRYNVLQEAGMLSNADMQDVIGKFADHYNDVDYETLTDRLEQAYRDIKSNLNVNLTLTNLAINIKNHLTVKKSA